MKGLRKYLSPFAPDQSGAAAVLCEFHGLIIILDAGGCAGNICGFDEPRWFDSRSAIFSAGLRDMDAILGRDDRLVEKIGKACEKLSADFIAVIGTPVPAVIGTDYKALSRMIEKKTGIPALTIDTDGTKLYDIGEKKTWKELFKKFAVKQEVEPGRVGIIGATGYAGGELVRILANHKDAKIMWFGSRSYIDKKYYEVYQNMFRIVDDICKDDNLAELAEQVDVIFTATPQGFLAGLLTEDILSKVKIVDLSADFRIKDVAVYEKWYGIEHKSPQFIPEAVYGLCEIDRDKVRRGQGLWRIRAATRPVPS